MNIPTISLAQFAGFLKKYLKSGDKLRPVAAGGQSELARVQSFDRLPKTLRLDSLTFELHSLSLLTFEGYRLSRTA